MSLKEMYLVHHTHMDVGYTDLPDEVLDQHLRYLDQVLDLCGENASNPPERQFHWTCESALLVQDYLRCRPAAQRERLLNALRAGWIELQACLTQPLTELASGEEMIRCVGYAAELARREGFAVEAATIDDIGGYAGRLPTVLQEWGVRYLVAGVGGFQVHLPWANLPHLFYLESKDGARVLVWNLGCDRDLQPQEMTTITAVYGVVYPYLIPPYREELMAGKAPGGGKARERYAQLEERLAREKYPYREVMFQYGSDNAGPDAHLVELIGRMNATGELPAIRLTTPRHFLRMMEERHGPKIPVVRGVITDPWILRANPLPGPLRQFRRAQRTLAAAEAYQSFEREPSPDPSEPARAEEAYADLHLYADHTYGLSEWEWEKRLDPSVGSRGPAYDRYRQSWAYKRGYAEGALQGAMRLERAARQRVGGSVRSAEPSILVWNTSSMALAEPAELYLGSGGPEISALADAETGGPVPFQRVGSRRYLLLPPSVPAMGYRRLVPTFGAPPAAPADAGQDGGMESPFLRVASGPAHGRVASVVDKSTGRERLDGESGIGLGDFLYHRYSALAFGWAMAGMGKEWEHESLPVRPLSARTGLSGPLAQSVIAEAMVECPGGPVRVTREVVLYSHAPRIDVRLRLDKPETHAKECCYVAFPFAGSAGAVRFEQNLGWVAPSEDLIPGAMQDALYCPSWIHIAGEAGGVTVASPDAPVFQFGRIRTGEWGDRFPFDAGGCHLYAWLYHNLIDTDDPIWQDVLETFSFSIHFHPEGGFDVAQARRAAMPALHPLQAELRGANPSGQQEEPALSFLRVEPETLRLLSLRRVGPDRLRLRIEEAEGRACRARISLAGGARSAWTEDLFGGRQRGLAVRDGAIEVEMPAFGMGSIGVAMA